MRRYWVLLNREWEIDSIEDHGRPNQPPSTEPAAYELGEMGDWLFEVSDVRPADVVRIKGMPFDLVFDAQDELAAFAKATAVCNQLREMCDG